MCSFSFDPSSTPFSRFGSYLSINRLWDWGVTASKPAGWYLRSVRRPAEVFRLIAQVKDREIPFEARATPGFLTFALAHGGTIDFCFAANDTLRVRARGCSLRLSALMADYGQAYQLGDDFHLLTGPGSEHFVCRALNGRVVSEIQWTHSAAKDEVHRSELILKGEEGPAEMVLHARVRVPRVPEITTAFDQDAARVETEFARFLASFPATSSHRTAATLAVFVLWVSTVAAEGLFSAPAVLMSKNWMTRVWSWDHCFNALGLARAHPDLAWQQFMIPFRQQDESGLLPDCMNSEQTSWLCTKNPIHGWALARLMRLGVLTQDHYRECYESLGRWARYWLRDRALDQGGLPYYLHGNEQFDNTTLFQVQAPYRSADLAAYLVILQQTLAELADSLGNGEGTSWRQGAADLRDRIVPSLWRGGRFVSPRFGDGYAAEGDCLFRYTALVLGRQLPTEITGKMVVDLREPGRFRTQFGALATEALTSPFYEGASYVRGPIWAPPNVMIADGLRDLGETEMADAIRGGFLGLCSGETSGMFENFNAATGKGQGDPAYTWTASTFLLWAQEAAQENRPAKPA